MNITIKTKNTTNVGHSLKTTEDRVLQAMQTGLARALQFAVGLAGSTFMSGPTKTMLGVRTGRLRSALASEVSRQGEGIVGRIGDNMPYAAKWEFGFTGVEQVRAHTRVRGWTGANGESLPGTQNIYKSAGYARSGKRLVEKQGPQILIGKRDIRPSYVRQGLSNFKSIEQVRAHSRKLNLAPRPYIQPALDAVDFGKELGKELKRVAKGTDSDLGGDDE